MEQDLLKVFKNAKYKENSELSKKIWNIIETKRKRIVYFKISILSSISLASLVGLIPMSQILLKDLAESGFYDYFSLIFYKNEILLSFWKEIIMNLAESLPTTSIIISSSLTFILFLSIKYVIKQIINNKIISHNYITA